MSGMGECCKGHEQGQKPAHRSGLRPGEQGEFHSLGMEFGPEPTPVGRPSRGRGWPGQSAVRREDTRQTGWVQATAMPQVRVFRNVAEEFANSGGAKL